MFKNVYNFKRFAISLLLSMNVVSSVFLDAHQMEKDAFYPRIKQLEHIPPGLSIVGSC